MPDEYQDIQGMSQADLERAQAAGQMINDAIDRGPAAEQQNSPAWQPDPDVPETISETPDWRDTEAVAAVQQDHRDQASELAAENREYAEQYPTPAAADVSQGADAYNSVEDMSDEAKQQAAMAGMNIRSQMDEEQLPDPGPEAYQEPADVSSSVAEMSVEDQQQAAMAGMSVRTQMAETDLQEVGTDDVRQGPSNIPGDTDYGQNWNPAPEAAPAPEPVPDPAPEPPAPEPEQSGPDMG